MKKTQPGNVVGLMDSHYCGFRQRFYHPLIGFIHFLFGIFPAVFEIFLFRYDDLNTDEAADDADHFGMPASWESEYSRNEDQAGDQSITPVVDRHGKSWRTENHAIDRDVFADDAEKKTGHMGDESCVWYDKSVVDSIERYDGEAHRENC